MTDGPDRHYQLALADGTRWEIAAHEPSVAPVLARLANVMNLRPAHDAPTHRLIAAWVGDTYRVDHNRASTAVMIRHGAPGYKWTEVAQLVQIALAFAHDAEERGAVLVHGALVEHAGSGLLLIGPGGIGKTTATKRLPTIWRTLSDDATLIVRDAAARYWAHPWPTWSRLTENEAEHNWSVERAVPLVGLFFLVQASASSTEPMGRGEAATSLVKATEQVAGTAPFGFSTDELRMQRLLRFENVCALAKAVPSYKLHLSLTGAFWDEIERVIGGDRAP